MQFRIGSVFLVLLIYSSVFSQNKKPQKWSVLSGYEVTYTGNNAVLHAVYAPNAKHTLEAGFNYNFSDGFSANPVVGLGLSYGYTIINESKWKAAVGIDYRRQKPLAIVNIQSLMYTTRAQYNITDRWSVYSRLGYGLAAERARSAGSFSKSNNISGSFSLGCVFQL